MAVEDVQITVSATVNAEVSAQRQVPGSTLNANASQAQPNSQTQKQDSVTISSDNSNASVKNSAALRSQTNEVINVANLAAEATNEIDKLVKSIGGILEQANTGEVTPQRKQALETEANSLVAEIKKRASVSSNSGVKPLNGDPIRLEVEEKLGRTLDVLLPDDAKDAFGIGNVQLSRKDVIINTIASVEAAKERVQEIQKAVGKTIDALKGTVDRVDVAIQNTESSETSVRDVDDALALAKSTRQGIARNPKSALSSFSKLGAKSLSLLEG